MRATTASSERLVVFDLDGTLIDSRRDLANSANALLAAYGRSPVPDDAIVSMVGDGARVLVQRVLAAAGLDAELDEALTRFLRVYDDNLVVHTRPYDGVTDGLRALASSARLAVLSNKPTRPTRRLLEHFDLADFFEEIVGGDSAYPRKPAPDALMAMMRSRGIHANESLFVGDSDIDVQTAHRAGVRIAVARYGFGFASIPPGRLGPRDVVIDRFDELLDIRGL